MGRMEEETGPNHFQHFLRRYPNHRELSEENEQDEDEEDEEEEEQQQSQQPKPPPPEWATGDPEHFLPPSPVQKQFLSLISREEFEKEGKQHTKKERDFLFLYLQQERGRGVGWGGVRFGFVFGLSFWFVLGCGGGKEGGCSLVRAVSHSFFLVPLLFIWGYWKMVVSPMSHYLRLFPLIEERRIREGKRERERENTKQEKGDEHQHQCQHQRQRQHHYPYRHQQLPQFDVFDEMIWSLGFIGASVLCFTFWSFCSWAISLLFLCSSQCSLTGLLFHDGLTWEWFFFFPFFLLLPFSLLSLLFAKGQQIVVENKNVAKDIWQTSNRMDPIPM